MKQSSLSVLSVASYKKIRETGWAKYSVPSGSRHVPILFLCCFSSLVVWMHATVEFDIWKHGKKPEEQRPRGRPRRKWEDNTKINLQEIRCGCVHWIDLAQDRGKWRALLNMVINFYVSSNDKNLLTSWETISFSRTLLHEVSSHLVST
jgi:hypothetical protein